MLDELQIAELLCTRLCHDLTGPIGAVNNGAEFLSEEGFNLQNQAVELIISSAFSAVTRLQFYRMAYGRIRENGEASLTEKKKLATEYFNDTKITLDWPDSHTDAVGVSISLKMARLIFNLLIIASQSLIKGGTIAIRISQNEAGEKHVRIHGHGVAVKWDPEIERIFSNPVTIAELSPKNVQVYLTKCFKDELKTTLTCDADKENIVMEVTQPPGH